VGRTEERIAEFIVGTEASQIPVGSFSGAVEACFDCVGVTLAGAAQPHGQMMAAYVQAEGASGPCSVLGTSVKTSSSMAALANGTLGHALDYDDIGIGTFGHPSVVLLPPALALSERESCSGRDLLTAYIIGYEVASHMSRGVRFLQGESGFHGTSIYGTMAATATACRLLALDTHQTIMALGIAGSMPSGVLRNFGTHVKPLHAGLASRAGVMAALLAQSGFVASEDIVEAKGGFTAAYFGENNYDPRAMVKDLGSVWYGERGMLIKKYPCCGSNHGSLDSFLGLMRDHQFTLDDVAEVEVAGMPGQSHVLLYPNPTAAFQGKFSLHYNIATALVDGHIDIDSFDDERLARPEYAEARAKVDIKIRSKWESGDSYPSETPVTVRLKNGQSLTRLTNRHKMHGTPDDPLTEDELQAKFRANARLVLPDERIDEALRLWRSLDELTDVRLATAAVSLDQTTNGYRELAASGASGPAGSHP
jgi:2-methylcitrate dehydratase PrpD